MKIKCTKCKTEAEGLQGHLGRKHQACDGRKKGGGTLREKSGIWDELTSPIFKSEEK